MGLLGRIITRDASISNLRTSGKNLTGMICSKKQGGTVRGRERAASSTFKLGAGDLSALMPENSREAGGAMDVEMELLAQYVASLRVGKLPKLRYVTSEDMKCSNAEAAAMIMEAEFQTDNALRFRMLLSVLFFTAAIVSATKVFFFLNINETWSKGVFILGVFFALSCFKLVRSSLYLRRPQLVTGSIFFLIGMVMVAYKIVIMDLSNGLVSFYVIVIFTATPLTLWNATCIGATVIFTFFTLSVTELSAHLKEFPDTQVKTDNVVILALTTFFSFTILAYVTYHRELSLRKSVINRHTLFSRAMEVEREAEKTRNLLRSMLPDVISEQLRAREENGDENHKHGRIAEKFGSVTIMFVELCDFNSLTSHHTETEVVAILNTVYSIFDTILEDFHCHKVETVGQVYLVVGGCPQRTRRHAEDIADLAIEFMLAMPEVNSLLNMYGLKEKLQIRIGLNTGSIVAGVVGNATPRYKLFGDPVNTASRMGTTCPAGKIQCSTSTQRAIATKFKLKYRGSISVKGKGEMDTFFLQQRRDTIEKGGHEVMDKSEMKQHIEDNHNSLFRSFSIDPMGMVLGGPGATGSGGAGATDSGSGPRGSKYRVHPSTSDHDPDDYDKTTGSETNSKSSVERTLDNSYLAAIGTENSFYELENGSRLARVRYAITKLFFVGSKDFRKFQQEKGLINVVRFAWLLLITMPVSLLLLLLSFTLFDELKTIEQAKTPMVIGLSLMGATALIVLLMSKREHLRWLIPAIVEAMCIVVLTGILIINALLTYPNPAFLMVIITFLFNLLLIPMHHRFVLSTGGAVAYFVVLLYEVTVKGTLYKAYTTDTDQNIVRAEDLVIDFATVIVAIFLQFSCAVIQDLFGFRDFCQGRMITHQNESLSKQKAQTTALLSQLLPATIVPILVEGGNGAAQIVQRFEDVTILFTDMVNFTAFSQKISPARLMEFLDAMYTRFDAISEKYNLYKVEVIGDAYFIVGNCPWENDNHTEKVVRAAHDMIRVLPELCEVASKLLKEQWEEDKRKSIRKNAEMESAGRTEQRLSRLLSLKEGDLLIEQHRETSQEERKEEQDSSEPVQPAPKKPEPVSDVPDEMPTVPDISIRIGVHVGSTIAGVVGFKDPRYHVFGEAVSLANMMESRGVPEKVHVSQAVIENLKKTNQDLEQVWDIEKRHIIDLSPIAAPQETFFIQPKKTF